MFLITKSQAPLVLMAKRIHCEDCSVLIAMDEDNHGTTEHPQCGRCFDEENDSSYEDRLKDESRSDADPGL